MKIGVIGIGNMGSAISKGLLGQNELFLSNRGSNLEFFRDKKVSIMENRKVVENSDYVILAVKPNYYKNVIDEIKDLLKGKVFISIAAGFTLEKLENLLGSDKKNCYDYAKYSRICRMWYVNSLSKFKCK